MRNSSWKSVYTSRLAVVLVSTSLTVVAADSPQERRRIPPELDARISRLIEQLGDSQYHARERAQIELRRLGAVAFDALLAAQDHQDIEIAMRARYLVRSLPIDWTNEADLPVVAQLFKDYSAQDRSERLTRAKHLSKLDKGAGVGALCRIMRFDPDRALSKMAAALVLQSEWPASLAERRQRAEQIRQEVVFCKRPGAEWLLVYSRTLEAASDTLIDWEKILRHELELLARQPQQTDHDVVRDLIRWQTELLLREGLLQDALASLRRSYELLGDERQDLYELLDWSVEHGLHPIADELAQRFAVQFQDDPQLLYRLAESQLKRGQRATATGTAERARKLVPGNLQQHIEAAFTLQRRSLPEWAESEFRLVVEQTKPEDMIGAKIRWALSEMLFDWDQPLAAAEMAKIVADAGAQNPQVFEHIEREPSDVLSYMNYYFSVHHGNAGDRDKQREFLRKAIEKSPTNPDFVIAMYRVPQPPAAWSEDVKNRIEAMAGQLQGEIRKEEGALQRAMNDSEQENLASKLNEFAWLLSNTEGDLQGALAASQKSLELVPDHAAFLDTLGRCYFAVGDLEHAVEAQSRAVKQMPWMYVMRRQLEQFEKALADSKTKRVPTP